ncbi:RnfH family protein [Pseudomonas sp. LP_7_YM]|uniref:RnfH family protein n=1 Tax=Pseudomonas sp. LP_7_YM TaxID=2485137 RepID=UPI00105BE68C|nr:RnfH family protein [Pseudomonas sp. LP_7_YM]TDV60287.1 hypothetical protein EC915_11214 [Pseudomonas sp. LP_7_YM]
MAEPKIVVEVVYGTAERQELIALDVPAGTTALEAVQLSGMARRFPELDLTQCPLGIFGQVLTAPEIRRLESGDRVELYRPLFADPKEVRRLRAQKAALAKKQARSI